MTIAVALARSDVGPVAAPVETGQPHQWTADDAREFLYTLQRLLGGGGIHAQRLHAHPDGVLLEIIGVGGRVTTPGMAISPEGLEWLGGVMFDLSRR